MTQWTVCHVALESHDSVVSLMEQMHMEDYFWSENAPVTQVSVPVGVSWFLCISLSQKVVRGPLFFVQKSVLYTFIKEKVRLSYYFLSKMKLETFHFSSLFCFLTCKMFLASQMMENMSNYWMFLINYVDLTCRFLRNTLPSVYRGHDVLNFDAGMCTSVILC